MDAAEDIKPWPRVGMFSGLSAFALIGGFAFLVMYLTPEPVPAPKAFESFKAGDSSFVCQYPKGWSKDAADFQAVKSQAVFRKGAAGIVVASDLSKSLMGEAVPTVPANGDVSNLIPGLGAITGDHRPAVERIHEMFSKSDYTEVLKDYKAFEEQSMKPCASAMGDARISEFSAEGRSSFIGHIHGYRATMLGGERAITVLCWAQDRDWPGLKNAFSQVVGSVAPGA